MLSQIRNSVFTKNLWGLMGLYLLNISVDSADLIPNYIPEDLSINDQESIIELIVEKVLGYENAIKEYDDKDTEDHTKKSTFKIDFIPQPLEDHCLNRSLPLYESQMFFKNRIDVSSGFQTLDTPPPKL